MKNLYSFTTRLAERLHLPLPGLESQLIMASRKRIKFPFRTSIISSARPSGVLILLYPFKGDIYFVLIRRPDYTGVHSGQISLPGGKFEKTDRDLIETAIREAKEEVGIEPSAINIIGTLTPLYIPPSNYIVTPVVAWSGQRPEFTKDPREVDEIIELGLTDFLNDQHVQTKRIKLFMGLAASFPCYYIDRNIIWGATAMILSEFRVILKEFG
ncbi:MAG: CoA pyrophosphatase [Bacteroidetes bacterium]|nr:CoA pyrophosphatase [Bacteroidota bacterium]